MADLPNLLINGRVPKFDFFYIFNLKAPTSVGFLKMSTPAQTKPQTLPPPASFLIEIPPVIEVKHEGAVTVPFIVILFLTLFAVFGLLVIIAAISAF
jgi:hypothetical protein